MLWTYLERTQPHLGIMGPPCKGLKGLAPLNKVINRPAWLASRRLSIPLARLSGEVALYQLAVARHFLNEQPQGSDLYDIPPWPRVRVHPNVVICIMHQCMADNRCSRTGLLRKKPTEW